MTDSATDVGVREVEDVYQYVRFLKDGEAVNAFVGFKSCSNAKAPGILLKLSTMQLLKSVKIGKKKLLP